jgi:sulfate transport system permease protein
MSVARPRRTILPGFGLSLGFTLAYLGVIILLPLSAVFLRSMELSWPDLWAVVSNPRAVASYRLTFGASFLAAFINVPCGVVLAWVLVRYEFPGRRLINALVDLPFALPTAVAGIALTAIYAKNGWMGQWLEPLWGGVTDRGGVVLHRGMIQYLGEYVPWVPWADWLGTKIAFDRAGIFIALTFIGLPFVVRTVQPVLEELEPELEEAAASLGATRAQAFRRVILPALRPAVITGFALAFARAVGEYGSVIFIAGNRPFHTEITPLLIVTKLEQNDYPGATALAVVLLAGSFSVLFCIQLAQRHALRPTHN